MEMENKKIQSINSEIQSDKINIKGYESVTNEKT